VKIFLSYASEDRPAATAICLALRAQNHKVFFDRDDLPPGEEYDARIRRAIEESDLFLFLISPESLNRGSYTLTEVEIADRTWRNPSGRMLPVVLRPTPLDAIPAVLKSVTLLEPEGNVPGSVADAVYRIAKERRRAQLKKLATVLAVAGIVATGVLLVELRKDPGPEAKGRDGTTALLVPAGTFTMGDDENSPRREIYLDSFYIDRHEVTTARYAKFLEATGSVQTPEGWETLNLAKQADLPVIGVDWNDANAYCKWVGRRLPTEAECEKAARGTDARTYPWGTSSPTADLATFRRSASEAYRGGLTPVGAHPDGKSPFGVDDLAGNAAEWVADWYSESFPRSEVRNPRGPASGPGKVIRGGGWQDPPERVTATKRFYANAQNRSEDVGFRCARDAAT
jgi:formylglycine-generating enzyme required for sulfatase activity